MTILGDIWHERIVCTFQAQVHFGISIPENLGNVNIFPPDGGVWVLCCLPVADVGYVNQIGDRNWKI